MDDLEIQFIEELEAIARIRYGKRYKALCSDRQRIVLRLHKAGFLEDVENEKKIEGEKYCPQCGNQNLTYQYFESALGLKGNRFICENCGFRWSED